MRQTRTIVLFAGAAALAATTFLAGCESWQSTAQTPQAQEQDFYWYGGRAWERTAQAPAPQMQDEPTVGLATREGDWPNHDKLDRRFVWTSQALPTGDADTSAIGLTKGFPSEARVNQAFQYQLLVTNLTPLSLSDVTVHEEYEPYFEYTRSTPGGERITDDIVAWTLGTLKPYETKSITVFGTPTAVGRAVSCGSVTYTSSLCMGVPVVAPELKVVMAGPQEVLKCDEITYTVTVSNPGTGSIENVQLANPLASGLTGAQGRRAIELDAGTLAAGQSRQFTLRVRPDRTGTFEQKVTAVGADEMTAESNSVRTIVRQPKLEITRTSPEVRYLDREIAVEIEVKNVGDGIARDLAINDAVPDAFQFVRASDNGRFAEGKVIWAFPSLAPNATRKVSVLYRANRIGSVIAKATASAYCADAVSDGSAIDVRGIPALMLEGIDHPDPIEVGNTTTYTLTVTNQGSAPLTNVRLRGTMDKTDLMQFVSASGSTPAGPSNGTLSGRDITFPAIARLAPGDSATFRVVVRALKPGQVSFRAEAVSDEITRPLVKEETTNFYE